MKRAVWITLLLVAVASAGAQADDLVAEKAPVAWEPQANWNAAKEAAEKAVTARAEATSRLAQAVASSGSVEKLAEETRKDCEAAHSDAAERMEAHAQEKAKRKQKALMLALTQALAKEKVQCERRDWLAGKLQAAKGVLAEATEAAAKAERMVTETTEAMAGAKAALASAVERRERERCSGDPSVLKVGALTAAAACVRFPGAFADCQARLPPLCDSKVANAAPPAPTGAAPPAAPTKPAPGELTKRLIEYVRVIAPQTQSCDEVARSGRTTADAALLAACLDARAALRDRLVNDCIQGMAERCQGLGTPGDPKCLDDQRKTCEKSRLRQRGSGTWSLLVGTQSSGATSTAGTTGSAGLTFGSRYLSTSWDIILAAALNPTELEAVDSELDAGRFILRPARDSTAAAEVIVRTFPAQFDHGLALGYEFELAVGTRQFDLGEDDANAVAIRYAHRFALRYSNWRFADAGDDPSPAFSNPDKRVTVLFRAGWTTHHLASDAIDASRFNERVNLVGTDAKDWMGFDFGLTVEYGDINLSFEVPVISAATAGALGVPTDGLTHGQFALEFDLVAGFDF